MGRTHDKGGPKANKKGGGRGGGGGRRSGGGSFRGGGGDAPRRPRKLEISFDSTSRREYLTGFASRKKERRAFGLAMQKVKDRKAKLEERKEQREAKIGEIEDIERNKRALRAGGDDGGNGGGDSDGEVEDDREDGERETTTFRDERTALQFGGTVSVTTTFGIPDDDGDSDDDRAFFARATHGADHIDDAQRKAGHVKSYIAEVKGTLGHKKKGGHSGGRKGQHGASSMKGMAKGGDLKYAKKALAKFKAKGGKDDGEGERQGKRGRKKKGRR
ncbi:hypothetical protein ACHAXT_003119 [Thalassiosira profunda]